jgi:hypothetical protein
MKKTYDLRLTSNNHADLMGFGFFEKTHQLVYGNKPFNSDNYVTIEGKTAFYRVNKDNLERPEIVKFLKKVTE